ncbi:YegS/Rv2252/BmrU family lipid kinase [Mumia sp. zg.B17]|uniref:diacylglycerol/lipid kinase family protein n=1 Tax=unclassified Mumia TaxID=2621872 RepID=UPI001C6E73DA|nr:MULTISPECIES: YegS/Rv2252/BmrU family lipid kinase [unclassified Mumia]MBW9207336.1 YegS/Rv2252/BmrU family lipid kinase [Mumia sp. zg.B17]MDD9347344.1 YegS/Rv2252/BmrU family lipid kinase [Mumia sp.]
MTAALLIANADAGSSDDEVLERILETLRRSWTVEVARTSDAEDLAEALVSHPDVDVVVVAGGDGSLHATVQGLWTLDRLSTATLALVPMGTGNDFARTVGLDEDPEKVAQGLLGATPTPHDIAIDDDDHVVVNAVHVGVGAQAGKDAEPWKRRLGPAGYVVGALKAGLLGSPARLSVVVDGRSLVRHDDVVQVAVGVGRYVGGGAPLLPEADPTDGILDVTVSRANPMHRRIAYGVRLMRGSHTDRDDVVTTRGRSVTISGKAMSWNADGETGDGLRERTWTVVPGAYRMLLPAGIKRGAETD